MTEAIFGLIGVVVGSAISWLQNFLSEKTSIDRHAKYLAVRVAWTLNKYVIECSYVVNDDGYNEYSQRSSDGTLEPQVKVPKSPQYPEDVDWRSIDSNLMYELLSFASKVSVADNHIAGTHFYASPPDYEEFFEERQYQYACLGLKALSLEQELRKTYGLPIEDAEASTYSSLFSKIKNDIESRRKHCEQKSL